MVRDLSRRRLLLQEVPILTFCTWNRDIFNRHLRQHGQGPKAETATGSSSIACDTCHDRKVKCPGGAPCKNCDFHGIECTRNREVKRRRPTRPASQDQSRPDHGLSSERQARIATRASNDLITSTMSERNAAMGFGPEAALNNHAVLTEVSLMSSTRPSRFCKYCCDCLGPASSATTSHDTPCSSRIFIGVLPNLFPAVLVSSFIASSAAQARRFPRYHHKTPPRLSPLQPPRLN